MATTFVQPSAGDDVEIRYVGGLWTRQIGPVFVPDSPRFDYTYTDFGSWKHEIEQYAADTNEYWLRYYCPQEGDTVVDVGAGRGEDTLTFSRSVGETGRVIAIEAHPLSFAMLKSFCQLNRLANVTPLHLALMDKTGTVQIRESPSSWMENAVAWEDGASGTKVRAGTLDEVLREQGLNDIAFVKMNIEGAERYALLGMESVLPRVGQICVACHDFLADRGHGEQFRTRAFVEQFLINHGFALTSRPDHPGAGIRDHVFGLRYA